MLLTNAFRTFLVSGFTFLLCCLMWPAGVYADESGEQPPAPPVKPEPGIIATPEELRDVLDLAFHVMRHKSLYKLLNQTFSEAVVKEQARGAGLSFTQVVYLLQHVKPHWPALNEFLKAVPYDAEPTEETKETELEFRAIYDEIVANKDWVESLIIQNDATQALAVALPGNEPAFTSVEMFVNHPIKEDPDNMRSKNLPASDLRQLVLDFIGEAEHELWYNVFDFDLQVIADALKEKSKQGVYVEGGVDAGVYNQRPEVKALIDDLLENQSEHLTTHLVNSVGLNHMKVLVRDPFGPKAAILFLSGNFTQSCIGPEGDAVKIPEDVRPRESVPNTNHAVLMESAFAAVITRQQLKITFDENVRGQSGYPIGGAFKLYGPTDEVFKSPQWGIFLFSPNGGLGDVNNVLVRLLLGTEGPLEMVQFAFSSKKVVDAIIQRTSNMVDKLRAAGRSVRGLFRSVGDTPFAMRDWSGFLALSGLQQDKVTKKYSRAETPLKKIFSAEEWKDWLNAIRIAPPIYGERHVNVPDHGTVKLSAKIHDKILIFVQHYLSVVGTSFNVSAGAESNNEQLLALRHSGITKTARQKATYLRSQSRRSVTEEADRRNRIRNFVEEEESVFEQRAKPQLKADCDTVVTKRAQSA